MDNQHFCLKWNDFKSNMTNSFASLLQDEEFVDVTISCDGKIVKAHKMVLSASSTYFRELLKDNPCQHPIIILRDVEYWQLELLLYFMYNGEISVAHANLSGLLKTAESLKIKGLTGDKKNSNSNNPFHGDSHKNLAEEKDPIAPEPKRKKMTILKSDLPTASDSYKPMPEEVGLDSYKNSPTFVEEYSDKVTPGSSGHVVTKVEPIEYYDSSNSFDYNEEQHMEPDHSISLNSENSVNSQNAHSVGVPGMSDNSINQESWPPNQDMPKDHQRCPVCHKTMWKSNLRRHIDDCHVDTPQKFVCQICQRLYKTKNSLRTHLYLCHSMRKRVKVRCPETTSSI